MLACLRLFRKAIAEIAHILRVAVMKTWHILKPEDKVKDARGNSSCCSWVSHTETALKMTNISKIGTNLIIVSLAFSIMVFWLGSRYLSDSMTCLLYTSPSPRDATLSRMPSSAWKKKEKTATLIDLISLRSIISMTYFKVNNGCPAFRWNWYSASIDTSWLHMFVKLKLWTKSIATHVLMPAEYLAVFRCWGD